MAGAATTVTQGADARQGLTLRTQVRGCTCPRAEGGMSSKKQRPEQWFLIHTRARQAGVFPEGPATCLSTAVGIQSQTNSQLWWEEGEN